MNRSLFDFNPPAWLPVQDKAYRAEVVFGIATDTQDMTGTVLSRSEKRVSAADILDVLPRFFW